MSAENEFWSDMDQYHDLAEQFERNIEYDREPYEYVTSRRMCPCLDYCNKCAFPMNGKVVRIEYSGPNV